MKEPADKEKENDEEKETEEIKIPTVKDFIQKYISDNKIKIETVSNKTVLEKDIHSAWKKEYPNHQRTLSTFHKELPREA